MTAESPEGVDRTRLIMRAQLRSALKAGAVIAVLFGSLPLLFALAPGLSGCKVDGVGLAWILLGVLAYPVLWAVGRWYVAMAEAAERRPRPGGA
ncbi:hypothetical protein GXW83_21860 [Streptacidiphilus sp. PB12-B1b]|uniref:hypothetical protein n=1 Tax=Streptacidiphilus sp. PB12-B1b TaxID=2705012 RepID=UPI0015F8945A|nr:hypothetical protein [Streptacidiphilus sp. PB12-B1b]QMU77946.1 hypothetical protein GXW83_21860 [Streptacidiphilus sp. PB12-B1b]